MSEPTFAGWLAHDASAAEGKMQWGTIQVKPFAPDDIDIKISHCGMFHTVEAD